MIDLFYPYVPEEAIQEVTHTLQSQWIGQGPKVDLFEKNFEKFFGINYAVSVNSGSAALETAYGLVGLQEGDEVITTALTCSATNIPLLRLGCTLVFADIRKDTLTIDPEDIKRKITNRTKAIVNVHLGGIESIIGKFPIPIISDACQALGIFTGDYTCCSFQAIKHITTGDGGMVVVPTETEYRQAKLLRWFGIDRERKIEENWQCYKERKMTFDIELLGYKRQMTDIAAALGIVGLKHYNYVISKRKNLFNIYRTKLKHIPGITLIDGSNNTYWLATVLVERRDDFAKMLFDKGINTNLVHTRNDLYKIFGGKRVDLPNLNYVEDKYICLPLHTKMVEDDVRYICQNIEKGW